MKTVLLLLISSVAFGQCEDRNSAGSISIHYSYGLELGQQGLLNSSSFFLGIDVRKSKQEQEGSESFIYLKWVQRIYQAGDERFEIGIAVSPGFVNTDFDAGVGVRFLYVVGRNAAVSVEPLYRLSRGFGYYLNIHFLL